MSLIGATRAERLRDALSAFHLGWRQGLEYARRYPTRGRDPIDPMLGCGCPSCTAQALGWDGGFDAARAEPAAPTRCASPGTLNERGETAWCDCCERFWCVGCSTWVPWDCGADDDHPNLCDECVPAGAA